MLTRHVLEAGRSEFFLTQSIGCSVSKTFSSKSYLGFLQRCLASGKLKQQSDPYQGEQIRGIFLISTDMCTREGNTDCPKRIFRDFVDGLIGRAGVFICKKSMSIS